MTTNNFTVEEGIEIQTEQLAEWKTKLVPECYTALKKSAIRLNIIAKTGYGIARGTDLSTFVTNWKPKTK